MLSWRVWKTVTWYSFQSCVAYSVTNPIVFHFWALDFQFSNSILAITGFFIIETLITFCRWGVFLLDSTVYFWLHLDKNRCFCLAKRVINHTVNSMWLIDVYPTTDVLRIVYATFVISVQGIFMPSNNIHQEGN